MGQKLGQNAPLILGGLSMGATTVLLASCFDFPANVRAIIADCGFTSPYEIAKSVLRRDAPKAPDRVRQELKAFLDTYTPTTKEDTP